MVLILIYTIDSSSKASLLSSLLRSVQHRQLSSLLISLPYPLLQLFLSVHVHEHCVVHVCCYSSVYQSRYEESNCRRSVMVHLDINSFRVDRDHESQVELSDLRVTKKTVEKAESPRQ